MPKTEPAPFKPSAANPEKEYFDEADPTFKPWDSAKSLRGLLPPLRRFQDTQTKN